MDEATVEERIELIKEMSHKEMADIWRNASVGHPFFDVTLPYYKVFEKRFRELGGMTTELSKEIGWY